MERYGKPAGDVHLHQRLPVDCSARLGISKLLEALVKESLITLIHGAAAQPRQQHPHSRLLADASLRHRLAVSRLAPPKHKPSQVPTDPRALAHHARHVPHRSVPAHSHGHSLAGLARCKDLKAPAMLPTPIHLLPRWHRARPRLTPRASFGLGAFVV